MESPQPKTQPDIWDYAYTHMATEATTGYFACQPLYKADIGEILAKLAQRPHDSYLREYALKQMRILARDDLRRLASHCLEKPGNKETLFSDRSNIAVLAELLTELISFSPDCRAVLDPFIEGLSFLCPGHAMRPDDDLKKMAASREWNAYFIKGLHKLEDLGHGLFPQAPPPCIDADVEKALEAMSKSKGILASAYQRMRSLPAEQEESVPAAETYARALKLLTSANIIAGPEMRHEASLSPIALLRNWRINASTDNGRHQHRLCGETTAWGRGLSLATARASCIMEIVERACAYPDISRGGEFGNGHIDNRPLLLSSWRKLAESGIKAFTPVSRVKNWEDVPLHWIAGEDSRGNAVFVPAQSVYLFLNLDEEKPFENYGSTGLATGNSMAQARLAALLEVIERDAMATTPYIPQNCFQVESRDKIIQALLDDYRARKIFVLFQDISTETGVPVYRCFVRGPGGEIAQASGASLDGKKAALSALTETPWPYSWATPAPFGKPSLRPERQMPIRCLEDLPNYSLSSDKSNLSLVEDALDQMGRTPVYVDISRKILEFPATRAYIPGLETNSDFDEFSPPGPRLFARWQSMRSEFSIKRTS